MRPITLCMPAATIFQTIPIKEAQKFKWDILIERILQTAGL